MAEQVGNIFFERGGDGSPISYTRVCEVFSLSGLGETNALVDKTTFCDGGYRTYLAGLKDGAEFTVEANWNSSSSALIQMISDVKSGLVHDYRMVEEDGGSPQFTLTFEAIPLSWTINPSVDDKNTINFGFKISGPVTPA